MQVTAVLQRSQDWWAIEVPECPGVFTQARTLIDVSPMVSDVVALACDCPVESISVSMVFAESGLQQAVESAHAKSQAREQAIKEADAAVTEAVNLLRDAQLTQREIGMALGLSHQRVSQLLRRGQPA